MILTLISIWSIVLALVSIVASVTLRTTEKTKVWLHNLSAFFCMVLILDLGVMLTLGLTTQVIP
jgi:hypothetical protein